MTDVESQRVDDTGLGPWKPPSADRVPINIHPEARDALRELLWTDKMRGVGYSEFIMRAVCEGAGG